MLVVWGRVCAGGVGEGVCWWCEGGCVLVVWGRVCAGGVRETVCWWCGGGVVV